MKGERGKPRSFLWPLATGPWGLYRASNWLFLDYAGLAPMETSVVYIIGV